jgi:hypothetical protein
MLDFKNKTLFKLKQEKIENGYESVGRLLTNNEEIVASFVSMRDKIIFTNKRIISVNVQGLTGSKIDYTSMPYNKIQMYSIETAGVVDIDTELDIWISGIGKIGFELTGSSDVVGLSRVISEFIL